MKDRQSKLLEDIIPESVRERAARAAEGAEPEGDSGSAAGREPLAPNRHPQLDFFVCDISDANPKDDVGSMEHPMFSLSTKRDTTIRTYEDTRGNYVKVVPSAVGMATIFDKDVLVYCISQLVEGMNRGKQPRRRIRMIAYDFLVATNRDTGGHNYKLLNAAFERLKGTNIHTNIKTNNLRIREGFSLIDSYRIIEKSGADGRMVAVEITLSEWLYNAVLGKEVLTLDRSYFRLRKALDRRIYELARKHCGRQDKWKISLEKLHKKTGSKDSLRKFRLYIRQLAQTDHLPGYSLGYDGPEDVVTVTRRSTE